jgi:hypothetical protein
MSDRTADAKRPSGAGAIVVVAAGMMVCAVLAAFLIMSRGGQVDGAAVLAEVFGQHELHPRYAIVEAREMPSGTRVVILDDPAAPPESAPDAEPPAPDEKVDWRTVAIPPAKAWPRRLVFTLPQRGSGQAAVDAFFVRNEWRDIADLGPKGGKVMLAAKKIAWRGFDADWVHERSFERKLTFRDAMSVNLSLEKQPCVLSAFWPRGEAASEERLREVLGMLGAER